MSPIHIDGFGGRSFAGLDLGEKRLAILNSVGLAATQLLDVEEITNLAIKTMIDTLGMSVAMIYLWDECAQRYTLHASHGLTQDQMVEIDRRRRSGWDITQEVIDTGKVVFIPDMAKDERFKGVWENSENRSYIKLPLNSRGTIVGVLGAVCAPGQMLTNQDVEFLMAVGREIGIAIDISILLAESHLREEQARTLYRLGRDISSSLSLSSVLSHVAEAARTLVDADLSLVGLVDNDAQNLLIESVDGAHKTVLAGIDLPIIERDPWLKLVCGETIIAECGALDEPGIHDQAFFDDEGINMFLVVPLRRGDSFLGLIEVLRKEPRRFLKTDALLLARLAQQVIVSVENARLYRQLHHFAILEERDRLARELHDHLSQGLGYLKIKAMIIEDLLSQGKTNQTLESLSELRKVIQLLYVDVREQIFNLRTSIDEKTDFLTTIQDYLGDYHLHYGLKVSLSVEDNCLVNLSPQVSNQMLRIIQEALTNVRRHSSAKSVSLSCVKGGDDVCFLIEDDGQGFVVENVEKQNHQRYGLQIMRERAESVGGKLSLESHPGKGTLVKVSVPLGEINR